MQFLDQFYGVVDGYSLPKPMSEREPKAYFQVLFQDRPFEARIVFIDHGSRVVRFSMRPHVLELKRPDALPALGAALRLATVKMASKQRGVLLCVASADTLADLKKMERADAAAADSNLKKGAKVVATENRRRREAEAKLLGVFVHKSALAATMDDEEEDDDAEDGDDEDDKDEEGGDDENKGPLKKKAKQGPGKAQAVVARTAAPGVVDEKRLEKVYKVGRVAVEVAILAPSLVSWPLHRFRGPFPGFVAPFLVSWPHQILTCPFPSCVARLFFFCFFSPQEHPHIP